MKQIFALLLAGALLISFSGYAQTNTDQKLGLPGDNLNLYAVMKLFQESPTLESFEKKLNEEDSKINNLDLNGDDDIDYIKVTDQVDGNVHNIILQVAVNDREMQDVAVFTVSKDDNGQVSIQLTGDEELYGKDYIIEPNVTEAGATPNPGYTGNSTTQETRTLDDKVIVVNQVTPAEINNWPIVQVIYVPTYSAWHSPYYWGYYPAWWRPWRPWFWDYYYGYHYNYFNYYWGWYRPWPFHRHPYWNNYYYRPHRTVSVTVNNYRMGGRYQNTYSRPDMRNRGMEDFSKNHPKQPVLRPGMNRPAPRPTAQRPAGNVNRPSGNRPTNPVTRPGNTGEQPTSPGARPTNPGARPTNPNTRPSQPGNPNARPITPVTRPNNSNRPTTRPNTPSTRPTQTTRPKPTQRPNAQQPATRPATRPGNNG
ncbi:MAG: hypothetical protein LCH51_04845 [Bacteroidetes bacterium]|nr:hypothetical protein [Bacteroidota bacterium]